MLKKIRTIAVLITERLPLSLTLTNHNNARNASYKTLRHEENMFLVHSRISRGFDFSVECVKKQTILFSYSTHVLLSLP